MKINTFGGKLIAVDGPNGVGKSTIIEAVEKKLRLYLVDVFTTKEPTDTELGFFLRNFSEKEPGIGLACLVAADRYEHLKNEIIPMLEKEKVVITDRYILSSLILQGMDGVNTKFIININDEIIKPDLQVSLFADERISQSRLCERGKLTRFEKNNQTGCELQYMNSGIKTLMDLKINTLNINNQDNLESNVDKIVLAILGLLEKK